MEQGKNATGTTGRASQKLMMRSREQENEKMFIALNIKSAKTKFELLSRCRLLMFFVCRFYDGRAKRETFHRIVTSL